MAIWTNKFKLYKLCLFLALGQLVLKGLGSLGISLLLFLEGDVSLDSILDKLWEKQVVESRKREIEQILTSSSSFCSFLGAFKGLTVPPCFPGIFQLSEKI